VRVAPAIASLKKCEDSLIPFNGKREKKEALDLNVNRSRLIGKGSLLIGEGERLLEAHTSDIVDSGQSAQFTTAINEYV